MTVLQYVIFVWITYYISAGKNAKKAFSVIQFFLGRTQSNLCSENNKFIAKLDEKCSHKLTALENDPFTRSNRNLYYNCVVRHKYQLKK